MMLMKIFSINEACQRKFTKILPQDVCDISNKMYWKYSNLIYYIPLINCLYSLSIFRACSYISLAALVVTFSVKYLESFTSLKINTNKFNNAFIYSLIFKEREREDLNLNIPICLPYLLGWFKFQKYDYGINHALI